jgi:hypothetical protein
VAEHTVENDLYLACLVEQGFDYSYYRNGRYFPRCSQCEVVVIQTIACHELRCPNQRKEPSDDEEGS